MAQIKITKPLQGYIIGEMNNENMIPSGTIIYCGHCGGDIGRLNESMQMPFTWVQMEANLKDTSIHVISRQGITHKTCGHVVSFNAGNLRFTKLEDYNNWFNNEKTKES